VFVKGVKEQYICWSRKFKTGRGEMLKLTETDKKQLDRNGITESKLNEQLKIFEDGIPFTDLDRACTIGDGILRISSDQHEQLLSNHRQAAFNGRLLKFVPASGAASRMFKQLLALFNSDQEIDAEFLTANSSKDPAKFGLKFFSEFNHFAFYDDLMESLPENERDNYDRILQQLLTSSGLDYASCPKGLIKFHQYDDKARTPFEEHPEEAVQYALDNDNIARIHFTVSADSQRMFEDLLNDIKERYESKGIKLEVSFSIQKPSTVTVAVTPDNEPFRLNDGSLLFRPGGHGALIENLSELDGDIIFIKNIDNVIPDKDETVLYKKLLCGKLVELQSELFRYLNMLERDELTEDELSEIKSFSDSQISISFPPEWDDIPQKTKIKQLYSLLNRPVRLCGVVKNVGEPGGGPFWVKHADGRITLQIVETSQIDIDDPAQKEILQSATHFNPVDLICGVRDYRGEAFHLPDYVDPLAGFISSKSKDGRDLKALELPGLWNGAMALWHTLFVEVPISTFNPVKSVNDLLRKEHQVS